MLLDDWLPTYHRIAKDLHYSESEDGKAGSALRRLGGDLHQADIDEVRVILGGRASIVARGPSALRFIEAGQITRPIIAAGAITKELMGHGILPDIIVSDLDGNVAAEIEANAQGAICFLHAHGDNMGSLQKWVPRYPGAVVLTMQCRPVQGVHNLGGLTDGDRAVETARHLGARTIELIGFDFDWLEPGSDLIRRKKMAWGRHIIKEMNPRDVVLHDRAIEGDVVG